MKRTPKQLQSEHWHRLGSLSRCMALLDWHLENQREIPAGFRQHVKQAQMHIHLAMRAECSNNQFVNPRRRRK